MLPALKTVFRIAQNNNVMNVVPNENKNFVFKFSEFEFFEFECFGSISHSLITVLLTWTHTKKFTSTWRPSTRKNEKPVNSTNGA